MQSREGGHPLALAKPLDWLPCCFGHPTLDREITCLACVWHRWLVRGTNGLPSLLLQPGLQPGAQAAQINCWMVRGPCRFQVRICCSVLVSCFWGDRAALESEAVKSCPGHCVCCKIVKSIGVLYCFLLSIWTTPLLIGLV